MNESSEQHELLVGLLVRHQDQLYHYVFTLLLDSSDAWDVLQEASMAMFRKADAYDSTRPFLPWAYRFAFLTAMDWRKRNRRHAASLGDDVLALIADERGELEDELGARMVALEQCLKKLPLSDRDLVRQRYNSDQTMEEIAILHKASLRTLYRRLDAIRQWLHDCINQRLASEGFFQ